MDNGFVILVDQWPLVQVRFPAQPSDEDITSFCSAMAAVYERGARGDPFITLADIRALTVASATDKRRTLLNEQLDALVDRYPGAKLGDAIVVANDFMRLFVNVGVMLRRDKRIVRKVFDDMEAATVWANETLAAHKKP